jgi:hypothetical protein
MLKINNATYGGVDITDVLISNIKNDKLELKVSNYLFGDTAPGVIKYLDVYYNDTLNKKVKEHSYLKIPETSTNKLGVFYSNNNVDKVVFESLQSLTKFEGKADILTCVWKHIKDNPFYEAFAMTQSSSHLNIIIQILQLLYAAREMGNYKYVSFLEHDVLYPEGYFDFPDFETGIMTNMNYMGICKDGWQTKTADHEPLHQMTMIFEEAISHFENLFKDAIRTGNVLVEPNPGRKQWKCPNPAVHINHGKHFTSHFSIYSKETHEVDLYWGDSKIWIEKLF